MTIILDGTTGITTPDLIDSSLTSGRVVYAGASGNLTGSSGLTFDGTKLALLSSSAAVLESIKSTSSTSQAALFQVNNDADVPFNIGVFGSTAGTFGVLGASTPFISTNASTLNFVNTNASGSVVFGIGSSAAEAMRLNGTGLGIGTNSPTTRLHLSQSNAGGYASVILLSNSADAGADRTGIYGSAAPGNAVPYRGGITFHPGATGGVSIHTGNNASPSTGQTAYFYSNLTSQFAASISVGNASPSTSGTGITFPATQSASSNANTLDDYEEGTWTPTYLGRTTNPTVSYSGSTAGNYVKIGSLVYCRGTLRTTSVSGGSGDVLIGGLPFQVINSTAEQGYSPVYVFVASTGTFAGDYPASGQTEPSTTQASLTYRTAANGATTELQINDLATSGENFIKFLIVYNAT